MGTGRSGQQVAIENLEKFEQWVKERDGAGDWPSYVRRGKLNKSDIAKGCNFADSVPWQNPAVKHAIAVLEKRLRVEGVLAPEGAPKKAIAVPHDFAENIEELHVLTRVAQGTARVEDRVKMLEEKNATLTAEVQDLRQRLKHYKFLDEHLAETGRMLPP